MPWPDSLETSILAAFQACCISSSFRLCFFTISFSGFTCIQTVPIKKQADNSSLDPCFQGQTFKQPSICSLSHHLRPVTTACSGISEMMFPLPPCVAESQHTWQTSSILILPHFPSSRPGKKKQVLPCSDINPTNFFIGQSPKAMENKIKKWKQKFKK